MQDAEPQAVLTPITTAAISLTLTVDAGAEASVRDVLSDVDALRKSVGFRVPEADLTCVVGIGAAVWDRLFELPRPAGLHPFRELQGPTHRAPATPGDLFFHIRANRMGMCFELAQLVIGRLRGSVRVVDEVHGFRSFDDRDLLGFVDGTANPEGAAGRASVLIGDEDPQFAGGSYVLVQKYLHDLVGWDALTVEGQERAMGRTKLNDIEIPDDRKAADAHVALNTITDDNGEQQQIVRFNMPFGQVGAGDFGTYFIGYVRRSWVIEQMLENMFIGKPSGNTDRILDFSTAATGNLFFVPSADFLDNPPSPAKASTPNTAESPANAGDGSLSIGSLKAGQR